MKTCHFLDLLYFRTSSTQLSANLDNIVVGIKFLYQCSQSVGILGFHAPVINYEIPFYSISFTLNILLTLMIVARLFLLHRNIRNATNAPIRVNGLYRFIVTSLIGSCAIYTATLVLSIGSWAACSPILGVVCTIIPLIQVWAPLFSQGVGKMDL